MLLRISKVVLCLSLLLPAAGAADEPATPPAVSGEQQTATPTAQPEAAREAPTPHRLSPEEEASLAGRSEEPGPEVTGGALSTLHLTYAVIALAAIVLVLLIK
jgi:hypothetical protein